MGEETRRDKPKRENFVCLFLFTLVSPHLPIQGKIRAEIMRDNETWGEISKDRERQGETGED